VQRQSIRHNFKFGKLLTSARDIEARLGAPSTLKYRSSGLNAPGVHVGSGKPLSLRQRRLVLSKLNASLIGLADGADVLVLDGLTMPLELLWLVAERLNRQQRA
jgi:hypothetical protein